MASPTEGLAADRSDRVLPATRALSVAIVPFLLVAFVVLYFFPSAKDTARLFAWKITPPFTPMVLGAVYLGGSYFFVRAARAQEWHRVEGGFLAVGSFASLMGIATILHWKIFIHNNFAFWLWAGLYFTTPFLVFAVYFLNRREESETAAGDLVLSDRVAALIGLMGALAAVSSAFLFLFPQTALRFWPWHLTPLTARVMGAIFALGVAGTGAFTDKRWSGARILLQVAAFMLALILVAAIRANGDFDTSRVATWVFGAGFLGLAVSIAVLYARMEAKARAGAPHSAPAPPTAAER